MTRAAIWERRSKYVRTTDAKERSLRVTALVFRLSCLAFKSHTDDSDQMFTSERSAIENYVWV